MILQYYKLYTKKVKRFLFSERNLVCVGLEQVHCSQVEYLRWICEGQLSLKNSPCSANGCCFSEKLFDLPNLPLTSRGPVRDSQRVECGPGTAQWPGRL